MMFARQCRVLTDFCLYPSATRMPGWPRASPC